MLKIAVIGAGVNGLSCAVRIKEKYRDFHVVLISSDFTPNTTGDGSGGLWYPYLCGNTPFNLIQKWGGETYEYFYDLWKTGGYGICMMPVYSLYRESVQLSTPEWANKVFGFHQLDEMQLEFLSRIYSTKYAAGHTFTTFVASPSKLLASFQKRFIEANGVIIQAKVKSLQDPILDEYDVVINCTGLAAREIVPDDRVIPIRGQIAKVKAPWMNVTLIDNTSGNYIIPNAETCVLGGTHQEGDFNTEVDPKDTEAIMNRCMEIIPGLKYAELVSHWVGLRPGRDEVRLEPEQKNGKLFIHNYGHGGSGLTLFWGCSTEVLQILETYLNKTYSQIRNKKSKL